MAIRTELEQSLVDFLERPPLSMVMELCAQLKDADEREAHSTRCRTLWQTPLQMERTWWGGSSSENQEKIPLIVDTSEYLLSTAGVDHLTHAITQSCFEWKALTLKAHRVDVASLRQLMRQLVQVDTLQTLVLDLTECGHGCVAAVASALPSLCSLRSFQLQNPVGSIAGLIDPSRTQFFHWLAYALLARKNLGLWLALDIDVRRGIYREIEASCRSRNCLQRLCSNVESVAFAQNGASAMLSDGSILDTWDPDTPPTSIQVGRRQRVDVIAQAGAIAFVVVPGVGLMTTPMSSLREWRTTQAQAGGDQFGFLVDSFAADVGSAEETVEAMKAFGSSLYSLTLALDGYTLAKDTLERIVELCPRLKRFKVTGGYVTSFEPLLQAYERQECQIESLVFKPRLRLASREAIRVGGCCVQEVIEALAIPGHPIARVLKSFDFKFVSLTHEWLHLLSHALWTNKSVEVLRLREDPWTSVGQTPLDALVDQPLRQNERSKNAMYEFLLTARRCHVVRELPQPCMQLIATYAAVPVLRCVSWTAFK